MRALLLVIASAGLASAEEPPAREPTLEERFEELEQQHRILARQVELEREKAEEARKKAARVEGAPGKGFTVSLPDGRFSMTVRARAQIRDTLNIAYVDTQTTNEINVKTLRLWIHGNVLVPDLKYFIQLAFGSNDFETVNGQLNPSPIFDAFVEYTKLRDLNVRFGQYFVPFDRARTIRELALQFVDRQRVVQELTLDRDVGIMFSSQDLFGSRGIVHYNLFLGGGDGRNRFGAQSIGFLYILRLMVKPWGGFDDDVESDILRLPRPRLAIGVAGGYNHGTNRQQSTFGNQLVYGGLDYGHFAADLVFKHSGFYLLAEVVWRQSRQDFIEVVPGVREWARNGVGFFVQASQMVHKLVEVGGRYEQLWYLGDTDPALQKLVADQGQQIGGVLNLYLNGHQFKIQTDYFYIFGYEPEKGRHQIRVQLDATF